MSRSGYSVECSSMGCDLFLSGEYAMCIPSRPGTTRSDRKSGLWLYGHLV